MTDTYDWDKLSDAAEAGELQPVAGTTLHGDDGEFPGQGQGPQVCRWFCRGLHHHRHQ